MSAFFVWIESTGVAETVRNSLEITAGLSAVHLVGFTLATGGALVTNLRLLGAIFRHRSVAEIARPATRGVLVGLVISIVTGALLFSTRAVEASENSTFQLKMLLLAGASVFQFGVIPTLAGPVGAGRWQRTAGAIGMALWIGLALAGCAFILFE